ncbi:MAG: aromatic amino acid lyase, partial [Anaerolineae bacterium]
MPDTASRLQPLQSSPVVNGADNTVVVRGRDLTIDDIARVARRNAPVRITDDGAILQRCHASANYIANAVEAGQAIYGVTTGFGGMASKVITVENAAALQN